MVNLKTFKKFKELYSEEELNILNKYYELSLINPNVISALDVVIYIFIKIMFEHPLADGNKRFAMKFLLNNLANEKINDTLIDAVCNFLGKEVR